jgi:hypothetical protein
MIASNSRSSWSVVVFYTPDVSGLNVALEVDCFESFWICFMISKSYQFENIVE